MSYFTRNMDKCSRLHSFPVTRYIRNIRKYKYKFKFKLEYPVYGLTLLPFFFWLCFWPRSFAVLFLPRFWVRSFAVLFLPRFWVRSFALLFGLIWAPLYCPPFWSFLGPLFCPPFELRFWARCVLLPSFFGSFLGPLFCPPFWVSFLGQLFRPPFSPFFPFFDPFLISPFF